ncbi:MAG: aminoacetone oxidase family FAD-binding enzyme [Acidobacteria bacterium]|nr:MAG: aminoacetone oxidase family FAD-binding enzyme [Acidobacteriota bacterium]
MRGRRVVVVGGGAAGVFAAIACAEAAPASEVTVIEKGATPLAKVRISGGGRCNVTHACFDARELAGAYPRGGRALLGPFGVFQPRDTMAWFEARGVVLKTEPDGRVFPVSDSSATVVDCLVRAAAEAGVTLRTGCAVERASRRAAGGFELNLARGETPVCDRLLLATGGCRTAAAGGLAVTLGHTLEPPVPSLFAFRVEAPWVRELAGVAVEAAEVAVPAAGLRERGPLLLTHEGVSGPAVLRASAWGARALHALGYGFALRVNWLPHLREDEIAAACRLRRRDQPARLVANTPFAPLAARLWEGLVLAAGIERGTRWAELTRAGQQRLVRQLARTELEVTGTSRNKDEFVTCGGVRLAEVGFKTMESRVCPGLFLAGELLDIDGLTGGFNFQAAWTTGWIAGRAMAGTA